MAGHSKWANVKHRKARADEQKGKVFTKLAKELMVAAREGGGDINDNSRLRLAVQKAREANMPQNNINRAIQKGLGEIDGISYEQANYEGYAPGGVAVLLDILTDNRNRTAAEIRNIFAKQGGSMGESGCVAWMFDRKGYLVVEKDEELPAEDDLLLLALEEGAEDFKDEDGSFVITTAPERFEQVKAKFKENGIPLSNAEVTMIPQSTVHIDNPQEAEKVLSLMELLEEHDDVQNVYANYDISEEIMQSCLEIHG